MENSASKKILKEIDPARIPAHIAVIMDGNGRWARRRGLSRLEGHRRGVQVVRDIVEAAADVGVKVLTLYTFSTENWKRPEMEVLGLMSLLKNYLKKETQELMKQNVKLNVIGNFSKIPLAARRQLSKSMQTTSGNDRLILNLAINYGGRAEIIRAFRNISRDIDDRRLAPGEITEERASAYMYTAGLPDPDLLIRTGGEKRISNFLLWQISYAELYFDSAAWPEFTRENFYRAIMDYQKRKRKFGDIP